MVLGLPLVNGYYKPINSPGLIIKPVFVFVFTLGKSSLLL